MKSAMQKGFLLVMLGLGLLPLTASAELENAAAELRESVREFWLDGTVEAIHRTTISAQTSGQVEEILYDVDDFVELGAVVIRLKDTQQQARLSQAEADLKGAVARLQEAEDEFNRVSGLYGKKLVSQSQMDKANAALKSARARQDAASAGLIQASEQLDYTLVKAPYSGIVTERHVQRGEIASPGQKLMTGISLDQLRVLVDVPQSLIPAIRKQAKSWVLLPDGGSLEAIKLTVFPYAHQGSNTFKVRLDLPVGTTDLFPGMFVKTAFATGMKKQLVVPRRAVVYRSEVTAVYVIDPQGRIHFRYIKAGHVTQDQGQEVIAGLTAGERVALDPIAAGAALKQQMLELAHE